MRLWYKNAVIYELDVKTFQDSDGDGIGDFVGLTDRIEYLASLGINCLWLNPFYPTPGRDDGYDVMDYYAVDPRLGTLGDFVDFMQLARNYGIRVIIDLVINHTSIEHRWFQQARHDRTSKYRDYYTWSDTRPEMAEGMVFPGVQEHTWTFDEAAGQYYFHRFYKHQPDLNIGNPAVQEEIRKIMGFWLQLGIAGFRLDAAPFVVELQQKERSAEVDDLHHYLRDLRQFLSWRVGDAILLAEANVGTDTINEYFGHDDKMHMLFNFITNQHIFAALAQESAQPLIDGIRQIPLIPEMGQWANFLRNHDELDLGRLDPQTRQRIAEKFAPDDAMWIYERGIRRRLAPLLQNDRRLNELAHSLIFTLPGTPIIRYGEEIGMGDDLSLPERNSVRTPMQWSTEVNGGFSTAPAAELIRPMVTDPTFGYEQVNVMDQQRDEHSLLAWMKQVISLRRQCPEFGYGAFELIAMDDPRILAHRCTWNRQTLIAVHNFAPEKITITLKFDADAAGVFDLLGDHQYLPVENGVEQVTLDGYGYRWFRVRRV